MSTPRNIEPTAEEIHAITGSTDVKHVATADTARGLVEAVKEAEAAPEPADLPEQEPTHMLRFCEGMIISRLYFFTEADALAAAELIMRSTASGAELRAGTSSLKSPVIQTWGNGLK